MPSRESPFRTDLNQRLLAFARRRLSEDDAGRLAGFLDRYYARVAAGELAARDPETLFAAAYAHWRLALERVPGSPRIRVANPTVEEDGWISGHTVIDIVTDDMPFLVDSVAAELIGRDVAVHAVIHPVIDVQRDGAGVMRACGAPGDGSAVESFMHFEISRLPAAEHAPLTAAIAVVLADVRAVVQDLAPMREQMARVAAALPTMPARLPAADLDELRAFLEWLPAGNFTFLGYRASAFASDGGGSRVLAIEPNTGLGLLRDANRAVFDDINNGLPLPPAARAFVDGPQPLLVTKTNRRSTVRRQAHMDAIVIKRLDRAGHMQGAHLFVGLFGAHAYNRSARNIPLIRRKLEQVLQRADFAPDSHDGRALINVLETFPRDELFQIDAAALYDVALAILALRHQHRVAVFVRHDDLDRAISCLVFVPRDRYTTDFRLAVQRILARTFEAEVVAHFIHVADAPLARLQVILRAGAEGVPAFDQAALEAEIAAASRGWADHLQSVLIAAHGEETGLRLARAYGAAFPPGYRDRFSASHAVDDINQIEAVLAAGAAQLALYRPFAAAAHQVRLKVFHPDAAIPLSHVLPMLEHLGVNVIDEMPTEVRVQRERPRRVIIHDFGLESCSGAAIEIAVVRERFFEALLCLLRREVENDRLNALVLSGGLDWRQVVVLRAYVRYLRQVGVPFTQSYVEGALLRSPAIAARLVRLFEALFDPRGETPAGAADALRTDIQAALDQVSSADDDRILRRVLNLIEATVRTSYFQRDGAGGLKPALAIKFDSQRIDELPLPRPMVEIFVYARRMEGIHLRGGRVARGGIRWSDRREDYRSEILGLMKAQMVKNAVIVPVGAKGGFVLKEPPPAADREALQAEAIACYRMLIAGLLDLTDTRRDGAVLPPPDIVRRDGDDPYLVVAADKGTATFSDIANEIAAGFGFWLGDAFASGRANGYDHKKMGITARGAWEGVKRHFRELGRDIARSPFTVVGVGDMSGDVFGNGMLLSDQIRLLAAFDHRHIFIDPDPDPALSFAERQRLFALPRSAWSDYDPARLSPGGAICDRHAKQVRLSEAVRARFAIAEPALTPVELIRRLLTAEVDLLWFGGIGTFVKAAGESDGDVGDRGNAPVRIDAARLRCKVVGEGANLAVTQLGRIEYARAGGRINTDFIDNAAGVDCSDHEVNLKILLDAAVADGDLTMKQRNDLLMAMTGDVAGLVLRNNVLQTQAISLIEAEAVDGLDGQVRLMRHLERLGRLNRRVEFLPDDDELAERMARHQGLTRPEIAVLFSYCKIWLAEEVLASMLPDEPHLAGDVARYFPTAAADRFAARIPGHRLHRELAATLVTNSLVNRMGISFVTDLGERTGAAPVEVARAYAIARDVFAVRPLWDAIEALGESVAWPVQVALHRQVQRLLERTTLWFLRHGGSPLDGAAAVAEFSMPVAQLTEALADVLPADASSRILFRAARYGSDGVPPELAARVAHLIVLPSACDIICLGAERGVPWPAAARLYYELGERFGFGWLRYQAEKMPSGDYWQRLAQAALIEELYQYQRALAARIPLADDSDAAAAIAGWARAHPAAVGHADRLLADLRTADETDLAMITVAARQLRALAEA
jgi:glutamate dehydrogenase